MKEKILIIFSCLMINIIFTSKEVLTNDDSIKKNLNITNNDSLTDSLNKNKTEIAFSFEKNETNNSLGNLENDKNLSFINQIQENINQSLIVSDNSTLSNQGNFNEKNILKEIRLLEGTETNYINQSILNETFEKNFSSIEETSQTIIKKV